MVEVAITDNAIDLIPKGDLAGRPYDVEPPNAAEFCPTVFIKIFPAMAVARCGGDWRNFGGESQCQLTFVCLDVAVVFKITAEQRFE